jgi:hypothetical protein
MSYLRYLCLFAYSGFQQILCCVFLRLMLPVSGFFFLFITLRYSLTFISLGSGIKVFRVLVYKCVAQSLLFCVVVCC